MTCPKCKSKKVKTIKAVDVAWNETYRKRRCTECGHGFFTTEMEVEANKRFLKEWALYGFKLKRGKN